MYFVLTREIGIDRKITTLDILFYEKGEAMHQLSLSRFRATVLGGTEPRSPTRARRPNERLGGQRAKMAQQRQLTSELRRIVLAFEGVQNLVHGDALIGGEVGALDHH